MVSRDLSGGRRGVHGILVARGGGFVTVRGIPLVLTAGGWGGVMVFRWP